jgi:hypothetical protein
MAADRAARAALLAVALAVAGCGGGRTARQPGGNGAAAHTLTGDLLLRAGEGTSSGCSTGLGGYADIAAGTQVAVTDGSGAILGLGTLATGAPGDGSACRFAFTPIDVPDRDFYGVEVAHRGVVRYSRADLAAKGWRVSITLGG